MNHTWSKWKEISREDLLKTTRIRATVDSAWETQDPTLVGMTITQERVCDKCGKIQLHMEQARL